MTTVPGAGYITCSSSPMAGSNRDPRGDWIRSSTVVWATRHTGGLVLFRLSAMEQWFSKNGSRTKYSAQVGNCLDILSVESVQVGQKCQAWDPGLSVFTLSLWVVKLAASIMKPCPGWQNPLPSLTAASHQAKGSLASVPQAFRDPGGVLMRILASKDSNLGSLSYDTSNYYIIVLLSSGEPQTASTTLSRKGKSQQPDGWMSWSVEHTASFRTCGLRKYLKDWLQAPQAKFIS